ncbi:hypothetical protein PsYK624_145950 [Phanerochaete sordida]|uniref:BTB domain-containing protein n=1 Tax=Phanerochaete sordida TaxID=48140 RepID=A0A9P3LKC0_9APHY|nr:hypothetical protein PsYK624_145950 [Phanerochaete sordida]
MAPKRKRSPSIVFLRHVRTGPAPFNTPGDFIIRTAQDTQYHVSFAILSFASPYFRDLPRDLANPGDPFVLDVPESDATIETLLRLTYPVADPILQDIADLADAYAAALKYQLTHAATSLQHMLLLPRFLSREPVRVYAVARRFGLADAADTAADHACATAQAQWPICDEFALAPGMAYQDLVLYHRRRANAAAAILKNTDIFKNEKWCRKCAASWAARYTAHIAPLLAEAPMRDDVFSLEHVIDTPELTYCDTCTALIAKATRPGGLIHRLKSEIRAVSFRAVEGSIFALPVALTKSDNPIKPRAL